MRKLFTFFITILFFSSCYAAQLNMPIDNALANTDFGEFKFLEFHDQGWLTLENANGNKYVGDFYYRFIKYDDIKKWQIGETVILRMASDKGIGIVRKKTGTFYKIFLREDKNPIDDQIEKCNEGWNNCIIMAGNAWDKESDFAFNDYQKDLTTEDQKKAFIETQKTWKVYSDSVFNSYIKETRYPGGTMDNTLAAWLYFKMARSRFFNIELFYH